jgi:hypothetical protein
MMDSQAEKAMTDRHVSVCFYIRPIKRIDRVACLSAGFPAYR